MLEYREHLPCSALVRHVRCFWTLRGGEGGHVERILPDGCFDIVFHLGEPFAQDGTPQPDAMLVGEIRRPTIVATSRVSDVFGIRFRAGGLAPFIRVSARELAGCILRLEDLFGAAFIHRVQEARNTAERIAIVERKLMECHDSPRHDEAVMAAAAAIRHVRGEVRVRALSTAIGLTERTLERHFERVVGMPPKVYARLARFRARLTEPLIHHGYYDDAHAIRDFREFAGTTPGSFARESNSVNAAFVGNFQDE